MTLAQTANGEPVNLAARNPCMVVKWLAAVLALGGVAWGIGHVSASSGAPERPSLLTRKSGPECVKDRFGRECGTGVGVESSELAISPDGKNGYLLTPFVDANLQRAEVQTYDRNQSTGSLVQRLGTAGCIARGKRKGCAQGRALHYGYAIAISPDGRNVYATTEDSIAIFDRDPSTGNLTQPAGTAGCITSNLKKNPTCAPAKSLDGDIAISPDGLNVYVGGFSLAVFDRDPATGALTQEQGPEGVKPGRADVIVSPDGKNVYKGTFKEGGPGPEFYGTSGIQTFDRDPTTGALTRVPGRAGCVSEKGRGGCRRGHEFYDVGGFSISPDGRHLYGTGGRELSNDSGGLMILDRLPDGTLTQKPGRTGCIENETRSEGCAWDRSLLLREADDTTVSADGKRVYVFGSYVRIAEVFTRHPSGRLTKAPGD
jgi:hypothetical protein